MRRLDALTRLYPQHAMGVASSMGLGIGLLENRFAFARARRREPTA